MGATQITLIAVSMTRWRFDINTYSFSYGVVVLQETLVKYIPVITGTAKRKKDEDQT